MRQITRFLAIIATVLASVTLLLGMYNHMVLMMYYGTVLLSIAASVLLLTRTGTYDITAMVNGVQQNVTMRYTPGSLLTRYGGAITGWFVILFFIIGPSAHSLKSVYAEKAEQKKAFEADKEELSKKVRYFKAEYTGAVDRIKELEDRRFKQVSEKEAQIKELQQATDELKVELHRAKSNDTASLTDARRGYVKRELLESSVRSQRALQRTISRLEGAVKRLSPLEDSLKRAKLTITHEAKRADTAVKLSQQLLAEQTQLQSDNERLMNENKRLRMAPAMAESLAKIEQIGKVADFQVVTAGLSLYQPVRTKNLLKRGSLPGTPFKLRLTGFHTGTKETITYNGHSRQGINDGNAVVRIKSDLYKVEILDGDKVVVTDYVFVYPARRFGTRFSKDGKPVRTITTTNFHYAVHGKGWSIHRTVAR